MEQMLRVLVSGPNGCGKSEYSERLLMQVAPRYAYFATLEETPKNQEKILSHRTRRDHRWQVYEATGCVFHDVENLESLLKHQQALLLDGLAIYFLRLSKTPFTTASEWIELCRQFIIELRMLLEVSLAHWIVVDIDPKALPASCPCALVDLLEYAHSQILSIPGTRHIRFGRDCPIVL
jgi:adenosyl cobinamide kinase/adenosyl cobinamide phosphate guanylyltransferase